MNRAASAYVPPGCDFENKGRRKGLEIRWADLVSGEAALATALNATLTANLRPPTPTTVERHK